MLRYIVTEPLYAVGHPDLLDTPEWHREFPNFPPQELYCNGCGLVRVYLPALRALQTIRTLFGRPMIITSAYRNHAYNNKIGGYPRSYHIQGSAFDVSIARDPNEGPTLERLALSLPDEDRPIEIGRYPARNFIHLAWATPEQPQHQLETWGTWS